MIHSMKKTSHLRGKSNQKKSFFCIFEYDVPRYQVLQKKKWGCTSRPGDKQILKFNTSITAIVLLSLDLSHNYTGSILEIILKISNPIPFPINRSCNQLINKRRRINSGDFRWRFSNPKWRYLSLSGRMHYKYKQTYRSNNCTYFTFRSNFPFLSFFLSFVSKWCWNYQFFDLV